MIRKVVFDKCLPMAFLLLIFFVTNFSLAIAKKLTPAERLENLIAELTAGSHGSTAVDVLKKNYTDLEKLITEAKGCGGLVQTIAGKTITNAAEKKCDCIPVDFNSLSQENQIRIGLSCVASKQEELARKASEIGEIFGDVPPEKEKLRLFVDTVTGGNHSAGIVCGDRKNSPGEPKPDSSLYAQNIVRQLCFFDKHPTEETWTKKTAPVTHCNLPAKSITDYCGYDPTKDAGDTIKINFRCRKSGPKKYTSFPAGQSAALICLEKVGN